MKESKEIQSNNILFIFAFIKILPAALVGGGCVGATYCGIVVHTPSTQTPLSELQCVPSSTVPAPL